MKKVWALIAVLAFLTGVVCACSCTTEPTPTPTPGTVVTTPGVNTSPDTGTSPNASASPSTGTSPNTGVSPGGNDTAGTIPNFAAGTVVSIDELPEIKAAVLKEYPDATIQSVTHEEYAGRQVYAITLLDKDSKNQKIYLDASGKIVTDGNSANTPSGTAGTNGSAGANGNAAGGNANGG